MPITDEKETPMTNTTILTFAFLAASYREYGLEFRLWHEMGESDRTEHLVTARLFLADPEITARETHDAWVARKQKSRSSPYRKKDSSRYPIVSRSSRRNIRNDPETASTSRISSGSMSP